MADGACEVCEKNGDWESEDKKINTGNTFIVVRGKEGREMRQREGKRRK